MPINLAKQYFPNLQWEEQENHRLCGKFRANNSRFANLAVVIERGYKVSLVQGDRLLLILSSDIPHLVVAMQEAKEVLATLQHLISTVSQ